MNYTHQELDQEIQPTSSTYVPIEEFKLQMNGREVLCIIGMSIVDAGCCGTGIALDTTIPGYIIAWKERVNDAGLAVSVVEPINDEKVKHEIIAHLKETKNITNFNFW